MIFRWVEHPALKPYERLMMVLFEMGMATLEDMSTIMGYTEKRIYRLYDQIRKEFTKEEVYQLEKELQKADTDHKKDIKKKIKDEKSKWAKSYRQNVDHRGSSERLYSLGPRGIEYCMTIMHERGSWEIKESQASHYNGINKTLVGLIQSFGRNNIRWYFSNESTDVLVRTWEIIKQDQWKRDTRLARKEKREMIRPDGLFILFNTFPYWYEFDNDTEKPKQLIIKYRSYRSTLSPRQAENINYPIVWVTKNQYRRDELENIWEAVKEEFYDGQDVPEMYFFVQGDELEWLKKRHEELLSS